jgi:hypothetical protein
VRMMCSHVYKRVGIHGEDVRPCIQKGGNNWEGCAALHTKRYMYTLPIGKLGRKCGQAYKKVGILRKNVQSCIQNLRLCLNYVFANK